MEHIVDAFSESKRWSKIVGIVLAVILVIQLISIIANLFFVSATGTGGVLGISSSVISLILAGLNLFASISLIRYSGSVNNAETATDPTEDIELACKHQGRYFKFVSLAVLLSIIMIVLSIVAIAIPAYHAYTMRAQNVEMQMQQWEQGQENLPQFEEYQQ